MDQSLKQRLVGAIVLISLAVIFLPLVFDGQQHRVDSQEYEYPEQPAMTIKAVDFAPIENEAREVIAAVESVDEAKAVQEESTESLSEPQEVTETNEPSTVDQYIAQEQEADKALQAAPDQPATLADAWIIQVGAFSSKTNAEGLRDKLIAADYKAYSKKVGALYKVYVGPEIRKFRLEQQKIKLERDHQLKALILKYIP